MKIKKENNNFFQLGEHLNNKIIYFRNSINARNEIITYLKKIINDDISINDIPTLIFEFMINKIIIREKENFKKNYWINKKYLKKDCLDYLSVSEMLSISRYIFKVLHITDIFPDYDKLGL